MHNLLLDRIGNHIILDVIDTWPLSLKRLIERNEKTIVSYLKLEEDIDKAMREDVLLRVYRSPNKYEFEWEEIITEIAEELRNYSLVGFHCTKLTSKEINNVSREGLKPLSCELIYERLNQVAKDGLISDRIFNLLINRNKVTEKNRNGQICFFHGVNTLKSEHGLCRFFRLWGGEALYFAHERDSYVFDELFNVGTPCIVLGSIDYLDISIYPSLANRIVSVYINNDNLQHGMYDFESHLRKNIKVIDIISSSDNLFEELTNFSKWDFGW